MKRSGTASMRMSGDSWPWLGFYQDVTASVGESFAFGGYYNSGLNSDATIEFHLRFLNASNSVIQDHLLLRLANPASKYTLAPWSSAAARRGCRSR
ncbi:hypothetical protein [Paenibacillus sp.]|uniref:hypothetical protein n=1 Tax=Paenibacillus sp. TaxID=58172 RepID=UPI002810E27F|nr:hypothetical protein [Paenibacillus sp.]